MWYPSTCIYCIFFLLNILAVSGDDKEDNENENTAIPLLMRNALPDLEGYEKNEKLDIALRPAQVSTSRQTFNLECEH